MKKQIFTLFALLVSMYFYAQQVPRTMVMVEIGTGTWCTYCPGAAMGADDLLEEGCKVAVVENHNGDSYANQYSNSRNSYYGISGYPTAGFDGLLAVVGGSHSQSMYSSYLPKYNQRIVVPSNITMNMEVSNIGLDYTATIKIVKVAPISLTGLKVHFFVTQSHISQNWQGQTHLNFVNRRMVPDQNGTAIDFSSSDTVVVNLAFTMDAAWPVADCEFITMVQASSKEVLQAIKQGTIDLNVDFDAPNTLLAKDEPVTFNNTTFGGYIGTPETYNWSFPGGTPSTSSEKNPTVVYSECGLHNVKLVVDRGSQMDSVEKTAYIQVGPIASITSAPGDTVCPHVPITLDAGIANATYLWSPGGETTQTIEVVESQYGLGSHEFSVTVNAEGCESANSHSIFFDACTGVPEVKISEPTVYPNPANSKLFIKLTTTDTYSISLINSYGETVMQTNKTVIEKGFVQTLDVSRLSDGMYLLKTDNGKNITTTKVMISK
jgi:PKD repeat protein